MTHRCYLVGGGPGGAYGDPFDPARAEELAELTLPGGARGMLLRFLETQYLPSGRTDHVVVTPRYTDQSLAAIRDGASSAIVALSRVLPGRLALLHENFAPSTQYLGLGSCQPLDNAAE